MTRFKPSFITILCLFVAWHTVLVLSFLLLAHWEPAQCPHVSGVG